MWFQRSDQSVDFSSDFSVEATVRIVSAPNHSINTDAGWPRPGYALVVYDVSGRIFWIGLGTSEVFLANTSYGHYGEGNTVAVAFNTTDRSHVYRIERAPGGVGAALRIDGVIRAQLPLLGGIENTGGLVYFGDPTYWANSESFTLGVRYGNVVLDVAPAGQSVLLSAKPVGVPSRSLAIDFSAGASGALVCEMFDTGGRRVARSEREVSGSGSGRFEAPEAHREGIYFYRLRLTAESGHVSEKSGRIVLIH